MADKLTNEAADECCMNRHFDYDLSNDYKQSFKDKFWLQHTIQIQTAEGPAETKACIRDLDDSLRKALHDKHKLGQSNQDSLYFQLWDKLQPFTVMRCGSCHQSQNHTKETSSNTGQVKSGIRT